MWKIYRVCEWIMRFAYVNFLWFIFMLVGLVAFGFFPATVAMFSIIRKWLMKEAHVPVFKTFWTVYKTNFLKSNLLGLILVAIGLILYIDLRIIEQFPAAWTKIVYYLLLIASFLYALTLLYVIPVFIHYDVKLIKVLKVSFIFMVVNPFFTISISAGVLAVFFLMSNIPGLIPFFSASLMGFFIMFFTYHAFLKNERKLQEVNE